MIGVLDPKLGSQISDVEISCGTRMLGAGAFPNRLQLGCTRDVGTTQALSHVSIDPSSLADFHDYTWAA